MKIPNAAAATNLSRRRHATADWGSAAGIVEARGSAPEPRRSIRSNVPVVTSMVGALDDSLSTTPD
jgi:hypothetical protein